MIVSRGGVCPSCRFTLPTLNIVAETYFEGRELLCKNCENPVDAWKCTVSVVRESGLFVLISLGAKQTIFSFELPAGQSKEIDLTQYEIPNNATILELIFTPQNGNCWPLLVHANRALVRTLPTKFWVFGRPTQGTPGGQISALVVWVHKDDDSYSWSYLVDAFEAMAAGRWRTVILPAYAAFEIALMPLVREALEQFVSKDRVRDFIEGKELSPSSALNIILPILCEVRGVRGMPDTVRGQLNGLRNKRNEIVHRGLGKSAIDGTAAGEMLCAAVFGLEYVRYARPRLIATPKMRHAL